MAYLPYLHTNNKVRFYSSESDISLFANVTMKSNNYSTAFNKKKLYLTSLQTGNNEKLPLNRIFKNACN